MVVGRRGKTKTGASEDGEECGIVWFVVIGYRGTGVWKEVKPDCVELTMRLGEAGLNSEPRERSFHKFLMVVMGVEVDRRYALRDHKAGH